VPGSEEAFDNCQRRGTGTLDQLLVTPMRPFKVIVGKAIPPFIIGMFEAAFLVTMAVVWFDVVHYYRTP